MTASRFAWEIMNGPIPPGMCVLHKCDVPQCVRPEHLWLGTKSQNSLDMIAKGRDANSKRRKEAANTWA